MTDLEKSCYPFAVLFLGIFLGSEVLTVNGSTDSQTNIRYFLYQSAEYPRDCQEAVSQCSSNNVKSGVYLIKPDQYPEPFEVYCDNNGTSTGWTVIQRRFDGSIGYTRNWNDFKYGFGFLGSEFWMGNEKLAHLTNQKRYKLLINMENEEGQSFDVTYDDFRITDEWGKYSLSSVGIYQKIGEFNITWCATNKQFKNGSICERRCENPNVCIPSNLSQMERCVCQENYMIHEGSCIPMEQCGCYVSTKNVVLMEGESYINSVCSTVITCSQNRLTRTNYRGCHNDATCEETNGVGECNCDEWFEGDGVDRCERIGPRDCSHLYRAGRRRDDVYTIYPRDGSGFNVYCEMSDGGWTIVQKRTGGSLSFYRRWSDYKDGFGSPGGDHWLGNDKIHELTSQDTYQLLIEKTNSAGASYHTRYSSFSISNENQKYRLSVGSYNGNAGNNAMGASSGYRFSTHDQDNDGSSDFNCAEKHRGGWWYPDDSSTGTTEFCYSFGNRQRTGEYEFGDCHCYGCGCERCTSGCYICDGYEYNGDYCDCCTRKYYKCSRCDGCTGSTIQNWCRTKTQIYETTHNSCGYSNLNGDYQYNDQRGIFWKGLHGSDCGIRETTMKIRTT